jgi:hypothetical protein
VAQRRQQSMRVGRVSSARRASSATDVPLAARHEAEEAAARAIAARRARCATMSMMWTIREAAPTWQTRVRTVPTGAR